MKVAVLVNELNIRGGTHKQVFRLCEHLKLCGHDVTIYTKYYDPEKTYPNTKKIPVVYTKQEKSAANNAEKNTIFNKLTVRLRDFSDDMELVKKIPGDTDIINIHDNGMLNSFFFIKLFKRSHPKIVWQINDLHSCFLVGPSKNNKKYLTCGMDKLLNRSAARKCDRITVNVSKNKERVEQNLKQPAEVFYCGVDKNDNLKEHIYPENKQTIRLLSTGVFFPYRNYESIILAVEKLNNEGHDVRLDIIGSTEFDKEYSLKITNLVESKGLKEKITIWGQVDEEKYAELYNKAHIFLFLNIDQSWGLAVFEAMSCGLPPIVSNSVGAIELLHNGQDSIITEPMDINEICDNVIDLMEDKELYEKLSRNAIEAVKTFTWENLYCKKMLDLFESLVNNK